MPAIIVGSLTVILLYMVAKEGFDKKTGVVSALLLCFLPWHIIESRIGVSLILTPFFGCLIFLALLKSINKKSSFWFLLFCFFLALGSFYTYQASLVYIPISFLVLIAIRKELNWLKIKTILFGFFIFIATFYPIIHLYLLGRLNQYFGKVYRIYYHDAPFNGPLVMFVTKAFINFKNAFLISIKALFINSSGSILHGKTLEYPLLIHWSCFIVILFSMIVSLWRRKLFDIILLIWLFIGYIGTLCGINFFTARYIFIILPPLLIFMGKAMSHIFEIAPKKNYLTRKIFISFVIIFLAGLFATEIFQYERYYRDSQYNLEECRVNSYGCSEAAMFLSKIPNIEGCELVTDNRMTVATYLKYFLRNKALQDNKTGENNVIYYVLWTPESHPKEYWSGEFSYMYHYFSEKHPDLVPIKIIYYPNGIPAINIFKVDGNEI